MNDINLCNTKTLFTLGNLYVSDFVKNTNDQKKYELKLIMDSSIGAARLASSAPLNSMYGKYWYRSGINTTMKEELKSIVNSIINIHTVKENDLWLDIACNDGTLLSYVPPFFIKIGIDPADNTFKENSKKHANVIVQDYFSKSAYEKTNFGYLKAKIITCIAMFYDLDNPTQFLKDVYDIMDDNGLFVLQLSYTPLMIKQLAFDNICHEHIYYYTLSSMKKLLGQNGFKIVDCQLNDVNGGSFRLYIIKSTNSGESFYTQPYRDVCEFRLESLYMFEKSLKMEDKTTWINFFENVKKLKNEVVNFIKEEKKKGKIIWGYGASTKGNTLLQYFNLDHNLISGIAEKSSFKWGLKTVGTNIPIYSEDEMRKINPDYLLILPWHFINEFKKRELEYLIKGGKFIVPCPKFKIVKA